MPHEIETAEEEGALTRWRHVLLWLRGELKRIKRR
jgi:hypothetical protein